MTDTPILANVELQLAGWRVTHNDGAKITFWIAEEDLDAFKALTFRAGKHSGQRLMAAFVLIGDDEQPVAEEKAKGGALSKLCAQWCGDARFRHWLRDSFRADTEVVMDEIGTMPPPLPEQAAMVVRRVCGIESRAELDHNEDAKRKFQDLIRAPYMAHMEGSGRGLG